MIVPPPVPACHAKLVFAHMRRATGATNWNLIGEASAWGSTRISGLGGTVRLDADYRSGRYARREHTAGTGPGALVYDGHTLWSQDISGGVHPLDAPFARERAITQAYLTRHGYWRRSDGATMVCVGARRQDGRATILVRIRPAGGLAVTLSVDAATHLLTGYRERFPTEDEVTRFSDYRTVGGLALPFTITTIPSTQPANAETITIRRYLLKRRASRADFARPAAANGAVMLGGIASATVPLLVEGGEAIVMASIDGRAPMPFILDTGGHAILTVQAARALGLRAVGAGQSGGSGAGTVAVAYAHVGIVRLGAAALRDQTFLVIPYGYSFYERGREAPLAGILGLEIFERFAVRIDYRRGTVTLTPFAHYRRRGGRQVPIRFQEDLPLVYAWADGARGLFGADSGNAGALVLFGEYLARTGLRSRYRGGCVVEGSGTGGTDTARLQRLHRLRLGGITIGNVTAAFTNMHRGSFSSWTEAGNLGYDVLARFTPTFDYATERLYLDPGGRAPQSNRAGFGFAKDEPNAFEVTYVCPGRPAAVAGIRVGDAILAVGATPARDLSRSDLAAMTERPAGTRILLLLRHDGLTRKTTIVLAPS